jgi:endo-1,4-beta-xylanase
MLRRRDFAKLCASATLVRRSRGQVPADQATQTLTLKDIASRAGLLFGAAALNSEFQDPIRRRVVVDNCAILTPVGQMKWSAVRKTDAFDFRDSDVFVDFATRNHMKIHGHTLIWYQEIPLWLSAQANASNSARLMEEHITTVVGRYRDRVQYWDVVNEVIDPKSSRADHLRDSIWLRNIGGDYIERAFRFARAADPSAVLVWNEDDLESDTEYSRQKKTAVLRLVQDLRRNGTPVQALGLQAHLKPEFKATGNYRDFLHGIADAGLKIMITELDVIDTEIPAANRDEIVGGLYYEFLSTTFSAVKPISVQVWELSDLNNWMDVSMPQWRRPDGLSHRPAIFDSAYAKKPAWLRVRQALDSIR